MGNGPLNERGNKEVSGHSRLLVVATHVSLAHGLAVDEEARPLVLVLGDDTLNRDNIVIDFAALAVDVENKRWVIAGFVLGQVAEADD